MENNHLIGELMAEANRQANEVSDLLNRAAEALAQNAQGEAVAWMCETVNGYTAFSRDGKFPCNAGKISPLYLHAERARVPEEVRETLGFYANGGHDVAVHIRDRKKGEPDSYAWWSMKRKQLQAKGYSFYGEDADGTEHYVEDGSVAQAALDALSAAPSQPEDAGNSHD